MLLKNFYVTDVLLCCTGILMPQFCQWFDAKKTSLPAILFINKNRMGNRDENESMNRKCNRHQKQESGCFKSEVS